MTYLHSSPFRQASLRQAPLRQAALVSLLGLGLGLAAGCDDSDGDTPPVTPTPPPAYAPVPSVAVLPPIPEKGYLTVPLGDGAYMITDGIYQMMFMTTGVGVIALDAPPSLSRFILPAIAEVTSEPITHVVYSHAHNDHIAAATIYPRTAQIIAHEETARILARAKDPRRPLPTTTFSGEGRYTLTVGSQTLHLDYHGNNHQPGELFIYAPKQKVLMVIDIVFDKRWAPFKNLAIASDVPGLVRAFDIILEYDFVALVSGHLGQLTTRDDVAVQRQYMRDLVAAAVQANSMVDYGAATQGVDPQNVWAQFRTYADAVTARCMELMPTDWVEKLGGADVFLADNCFVMTESLRID